jgi:glyoxylase-like metal-dependent hydrolase (beta-lactamase superfamily II)
MTLVNVFASTHPSGAWTLIDAAIPFSERYIRRWAEKKFRTPPNAIVLSHVYFDHVSSARALADHWDAPIYGHRLEFPYLAGQKEYPAPNTHASGGIMPLLAPLFPRGPIDLGDRLRELASGAPSGLPSGNGQHGSLLESPGWQIIDTPGHTPGHVSFFRPEDRVLLPADAFCTTNPESLRRQHHPERITRSARVLYLELEPCSEVGGTTGCARSSGRRIGARPVSRGVECPSSAAQLGGAFRRSRRSRQPNVGCWIASTTSLSAR